jgi:hypothetical protein
VEAAEAAVIVATAVAEAATAEETPAAITRAAEAIKVAAANQAGGMIAAKKIR